MSLAHVLLTSLLEKPSSGYDLARRFDKSMGFFWNATHQQIYRELKKMEQAGWISSQPAADAGKTKKRIYEVLNTGELELKQWVALAAEPYQLRQELMVRLRAEAILGPLGLEQELKRHLQIHQEKLKQFQDIEQHDFINKQPLNREQILQYQILKLGIETQKLGIEWTIETIQLLEQPI
jgi:DNA-binding PadR family transcriptional regulator